jgi:hypothetical protein
MSARQQQTIFDPKRDLNRAPGGKIFRIRRRIGGKRMENVGRFFSDKNRHDIRIISIWISQRILPENLRLESL